MEVSVLAATAGGLLADPQPVSRTLVTQFRRQVPESHIILSPETYKEFSINGLKPGHSPIIYDPNEQAEATPFVRVAHTIEKALTLGCGNSTDRLYIVTAPKYTAKFTPYATKIITATSDSLEPTSDQTRFPPSGWRETDRYAEEKVSPTIIQYERKGGQDVLPNQLAVLVQAQNP